jgi:predicted DNA-binding transcriptional regulator AlpA
MPLSTRQFLTPTETANLARVTKKTLRDWGKDPENTFPKPVRFSGRVVRYSLDEVEAWLGRARAWVNRVLTDGEVTTSEAG